MILVDVGEFHAERKIKWDHHLILVLGTHKTPSNVILCSFSGSGSCAKSLFNGLVTRAALCNEYFKQYFYCCNMITSIILSF